jgi:hypothetical protein
MPDPLPLPVREFIADHIRSISHLELLLLLQADQDKSWTPQSAAAALYTAVNMTEALFENLRSAKLVVFDGSDNAYRFQPPTDDMGKIISSLAKLYKERRISVIGAIYTDTAAEIRNLAEGFRLRKKED